MGTTRTARVLGSLLTTWLAIEVASAQGPADQTLPTFKSSTDVVTIQASVRDGRGRPVADLKASDFDVLDNGLRKPILSVRFDRESPVSVAMLVDMSGSMGLAAKVDMARHAFDSVLLHLRSGTDEVAVFTFDSTLHERQPFTSDLHTVRDALEDFEPFGTTSLYDAAASAAQRLTDRPLAHKAIVVLTDGIDTSSTLSAREVSALASAIDVPVYMVATIPSLDQRSLQEGAARSSASTAADLRDLAEWTGGQFVFATTPVETTTAAQTVIGELRQQYVLAIEAGTSQRWRSLDVRVKRPATSVRARSGYIG